jgi:aminoglycoside 3-N-acetyltransferase
VRWDDLDVDDSDFADIGEAFAATGAERTGPVGAGTGRLLRQREIVDFAVGWMTGHRPESLA